jgi:hypothetical protein
MGIRPEDQSINCYILIITNLPSKGKFTFFVIYCLKLINDDDLYYY